MPASIDIGLTLNKKLLMEMRKKVDRTSRRRFVEGAYEITANHGIMLLGMIKTNASRRPGPLIRTGRYRESWELILVQDRDWLIAVVGTRHPAGWRLEYGFVGTDALGREYSQPPYPHFRPAVAKVVPLYEEALMNHVNTYLEAA